MPRVLLHGGDLPTDVLLFFLVAFVLANALAVAAFVGALYLLSKRWPPTRAVANPAASRETERTTK